MNKVSFLAHIDRPGVGPPTHYSLANIISTILDQESFPAASKALDMSVILTFFFRAAEGINGVIKGEDATIYHMAIMNSGLLVTLKVHKYNQEGMVEYTIGRELDAIRKQTPNFVRFYNSTRIGSIVSSGEHVVFGRGD